MKIQQHWRCKELGYEWRKKGDQQEICSGCFKIIFNRKLHSLLNIKSKFVITKAVDSGKHLENLQQNKYSPKHIFKEDTDASRVANLLYHLRYVLKQDVQTIEHLGKMSPQSLNWYLINYPWYPGIVHNS